MVVYTHCGNIDFNQRCFVEIVLLRFTSFIDNLGFNGVCITCLDNCVTASVNFIASNKLYIIEKLLITLNGCKIGTLKCFHDYDVICNWFLG